ncbi:MAG: heavy metal-responsive transcriptional regulator [Proteobacteria bacterium]|nr:heavy metal-responsive transcriptional regulator [Pseudomonadota bacterium]
MFTIGKLASSTGVSRDTLRYYEREGLVQPTAKSPAGFRLYEPEALRRIRFIKHAQDCGFTLAEIRELLLLRTRDEACCGDVRTRAIEKKLQIENKIRAMRAMSAALDHLIAECANEARPVKECTIIAALEQSISPRAASERMGSVKS